MFKEEIYSACDKVCVVKRRGRCVKRTAWWAEGMRKVIEEKRAYREWLGGRGDENLGRQKKKVS